MHGKKIKGYSQYRTQKASNAPHRADRENMRNESEYGLDTGMQKWTQSYRIRD